MATFEEEFRARHHCSSAVFFRACFYRCLNRRAVPLAILLGGQEAAFFEADRELVKGIARARNLAEVDEEVREYFSHPAGRGWLHRKAGFRISTSKVRKLARGYLAAINPLHVKR